MATSSYKSFLMTKNNSDWEKLIDIKGYPNLGGTPELLDTTTLTDRAFTYTPGIQKMENLEFDCNYDLTDYRKILALQDQEKEYAVWFGGTELGDSVTPTGTDGKFKCKGKLSVYVEGAGVNAVRNMKVALIPSTPITLDGSI